jgi:glycosyltransferase involved in cell wall biosynthesis
MAGKRGVGFKEISDTVERYNLWDHVIMPGYIQDAEKEWLFDHAQFFVFPSLYEGFGLPILESFQHRVPVLTADTSSLPEVAGKAALFAAPDNPFDIAEGIKKLALDAAVREQFVEKGIERLKAFSWLKAADDTWRVLSE